MRKIINRIVEEKNIINDVIERLNSNDRLTFIYGCGNSGEQLAKRCNEEAINGFVVSDENRENYSENYKVLNKYPLYKLSELAGQNQDICLLVSIAPTDDLEKRFSKICQIREIYYLDGQQLLFKPLTYEYVKENSDLLDELYENLSDEYSRELLVAYLNARISGNLKYMKKYAGVTRQDIYFDRDIWGESLEKTYIDCGAYTGDTIENFVQFAGNNYTKILAFEPNKENLIFLNELKKKYNNIEIINKGVWNKTERLTFNSEKGPMSEITFSGNAYVDVDRIDDCITNEKVTMIKMNIEGSEYNALLGAEKTIKKDKPKLAISVYHKPEDLFTIPQLIDQFVSDYKFKLRLYSYGTGLLILFALK